jgi:prolyl oligopeptidase
MSDRVEDQASDPYLWLEDVTGEAALAWVDGESERTRTALCDAGFEADRSALSAIYNSPAQIPYINKRGPFVYNFWRDREHRRGLWRRTTLPDYRTENPDWDVLLDIDALAEVEGEDWVWHGCRTLPYAHTRGLVILSRGGADANVVREFDLTSRRFLERGFALPEAKQSIAWIDADTIFVASALRASERTNAGYARTVRRWQRGTPFEASTIVFEGKEADVAVSVAHDSRPGYHRDVFIRRIDFFNCELFIDTAGEGRRKIDVPQDAAADVERDLLTLRLRSDWTVGGRRYQAGSLLAIALDTFLSGGRDFAVLFTPGPRTSLEAWVSTKHHVFLNLLDNVCSRIVMATPKAAGFELAPVEGLPQNVSIGLFDGEDEGEDADTLAVTITGFLTPAKLNLFKPGAPLEPLKAAPTVFDASNLEVTQHEAASIDGVLIPYFQIGPRNVPLDGDNRVVMTGYGGFDVSVTPYYLSGDGKIWLERGGILVVANLRGGGEFGPAWHEAGRRAGKRLAQDDFAAIAKDLIGRGVTRPARLAGQGGSNAGLLIGNMLTRYPELFGALWSSVPLLDMQRYTKLLAGASWIAEYGDPDIPEDWAFLRTFSPYHLVENGRTYPPVFFTTSRRDDRVHPGHARKMAAKMLGQGHDVFFHEPGDGGHGGSDKEHIAFVKALGWAFLKRRIGVPG